MIIYDDIFSWEGWGGLLKLASGRCHLKIFDLTKGSDSTVAVLRNIVVVASDIPGSKMTIKSCSGHIATKITEKFNIDPSRMLFVEYYPDVVYGNQNQYVIPEKYESIEFEWHGERAINPKSRLLKPPMLDVVKDLLNPGNDR